MHAATVTCPPLWMQPQSHVLSCACSHSHRSSLVHAATVTRPLLCMQPQSQVLSCACSHSHTSSLVHAATVTGPPLCMQPQSQVLPCACRYTPYLYTPTVCSKCLQVFVTVVFSVDSILSVTVSGRGPIPSPIGHLLLEVPSSTVGVVSKVRPTPTLAVGSADPEGGVFGLTKLDPFPTYRGMSYHHIALCSTCQSVKYHRQPYNIHTQNAIQNVIPHTLLYVLYLLPYIYIYIYIRIL